MYSKGDIVFYFHQNAKPDARTKSGAHSWVILHSYTHPLNTYLIAPITSEEGYKDTSVKLLQKDYPDILEHDSYVDLRAITAVNPEHWRKVKGLDSNKKNTIELHYVPALSPKDRVKVDLAAIVALELGSVVNGLVEHERKKITNTLKEELEHTLEHILEAVDDAGTRETIKNLFEALMDRVGIAEK